MNRMNLSMWAVMSRSDVKSPCVPDWQNSQNYISLLCLPLCVGKTYSFSTVNSRTVSYIIISIQQGWEGESAFKYKILGA